MSVGAIPVHVALVDHSGKVPLSELQSLAASLNEQIQRDFAPHWNVKATVGAYAQGTVPPGTWKAVIKSSLDEPGALGYHTDTKTNQPVAYIEYQPPGPEGYSVTVSHEVLEMLADPYGNRMHSAVIPQGTTPDQFQVQKGQFVFYLLEVSDPCESTSVQIGGDYLSDFLLPSWYYTSPAINAAYSCYGGCSEPRQVADGGYVSFSNQANVWWQVFNEQGNLQVQNLGTFNSSQFNSIREWTDMKSREYRAGK